MVVVEDDSPGAISEVLLPPGFTSPTLPDVLGPMLLLVSYRVVFVIIDGGLVLVLDVKHLLYTFLVDILVPAHSHGEVTAIPRIAGSHHVHGVKHLLGQLGDSQYSEDSNK